MRENRTLKLTVLAMMTGLSILLYYFISFPLPFIFPPFLKIQFSNVPAIIGGFMLGPAGGATIVVIRQLVKLPASETLAVGEFADLIIGLPVVLSSSIVYMKMRTKQGAIIASFVGIVTWVVVATIGNYFIFIPFYIQFYFGGSIESFINLLAIIPGITEENYMWRYTLFAVIPFNILLSSIVFGITFVLYKRIVHLIEMIHEKVWHKDVSLEDTVEDNQADEL